MTCGLYLTYQIILNNSRRHILGLHSEHFFMFAFTVICPIYMSFLNYYTSYLLYWTDWKYVCFPQTLLYNRVHHLEMTNLIRPTEVIQPYIQVRGSVPTNKYPLLLGIAQWRHTALWVSKVLGLICFSKMDLFERIWKSTIMLSLSPQYYFSLLRLVSRQIRSSTNCWAKLSVYNFQCGESAAVY